MQSDVIKHLLSSVDVQHLRPMVVDVGASDGYYTSNSYDLIKNHGWRGLLIDPQEDKIKKAQETHADCLDRVNFLPVALAERTCRAVLFGHINDGDGSQTENHGATLLPMSDSPVQKSINTMGYTDFLRIVNLDEVGVLTIDTEGYDYNIIYGLLTHTTKRPQVIITEREHFLCPKERKYKENFLKQWYELIHDEIDQTYLLKTK